MVTVVVAAAAPAEAVSVSVEVAVPFAGGVTEVGENTAVTPLGRPEALSVVAELKLSWLVIVIVLVPPARVGVMVRLVGAADTVKFGAAITVRLIVVVAVKLPDVPVTVTVVVPEVAPADAVSVNTLVVVVLVGLKDAVTPLGRPEAAKVTLPVKPSRGFTVIVLVPPAPPGVIDRLVGAADSVKLAAELTVMGT
jgi:hypothetical protein